jgi:acetyl-CoA carboxylase biotin carboxyl carrier protein
MAQEKTPGVTRGGMEVDAALVRELAELLKETDLSEIEVQDGERRIRVARQMTAVAAAPVAAPMVAAPAALVAAPAAVTASAAPPAGMVPSPMVGTAYLSSEPGKPPFITVGSMVSEGATLMIIEAMKVMNPIVAPRAGTISRIYITNGQAVEYGEPLVVIN